MLDHQPQQPVPDWDIDDLALPPETGGLDLNPLHDFVSRYRSDPHAFVVNVFKCTPDGWQALILKAIGRGALRISIRSGNGVGKTTLLAWLAVWFVCCRYPSKTVCTAPTAPQLFDALWSDIKFWINQLPDAVRCLLDVTSEKIGLRADMAGAFISARTSRPETPEALQGVHAANVLLIVDEASGVDERVYQAGQSSMSTPGAITVLASNPLRNSGFFYRTHTDLADLWTTLRISGVDSPRVARPFIEEIRRTYGEQSMEYRVKVLGEFPLADTDTYISAALVKAAMERSVVIDPNSPAVWGVDVARFGSDRSVLFKRTARAQIEQPRIWRNVDLMQLVGAIKNDYDALAVPYRPLEILVDSIGLGAGVVDRLRELQLPAFGVNVSESPAVKTDFVRLRDELYFEIRQWLESRETALIKDDGFAQELQGVRYSFTSTGKLKIEGKDDMRKRMKASPDISDAFAMTFAGQAAVLSGQSQRFPFNRPLPNDDKWVV
jgi:hypothetical protein